MLEKFVERNVSRNLTIVKETVAFRINTHILIEEELIKNGEEELITDSDVRK
jgi:hypothetical protein